MKLFTFLLFGISYMRAQENTTITGTVTGSLSRFRLVQFVTGTDNVQSLSSSGGALGISTLDYTAGQTATVVTSGPYICEFATPPTVGNIAITEASALCGDSLTTSVNNILRSQGVVGRILALRPSDCANCALLNVLGAATFGGLYPSDSLSGSPLSTAVVNVNGTVTYTFTNGEVTTSAASLQAPLLYFFGSGADGSFTCSTSNATSGPLTSGSLTRDAFWQDLTVNAGCAINTAGYRVFVRGTLDIQNAPAQSFRGASVTGAGGNATNAAGGAAGAGYTGISIGGASSGGVGGAGSLTAGVQAAASQAGNNGGASGAGGAGGLGPSGAGGISRAGATVTARSFGRYSPDLTIGVALINSGAAAPGGSGGGGGGGSATGFGGGGGGRGGGIGWFAAFNILRSASTPANVFSYSAGAGGNGGDCAIANCGGGGGGAGGGGGWILLYYWQLSGVASANSVLGVNGGNGGNGGSAQGTGVVGSGGGGGSCGRILKYSLSDGEVTDILGAAGSANSGQTGGLGCVTSGTGSQL